MDKMTKAQRSYCMSQIRSKWTKPEVKVHNILKGNKIRHKMHPKIEGSPDIILKDRKLAIFIHGCFWHKCPKCYKEPKSNKKYWLPKIERNVERDNLNKKMLKKQGYKSLVIWEHEI
ncbi:MAG: very short patch repair endonuclease [Candidatus Nanoarchaeia archaeon]|jgi:DNA mismatch endonuclease (patch repair protein)